MRIVAALLCLLSVTVAVAQQPAEPPRPAPLPGRAELVIPDELWERIRAHAGFDGPIGYTRDQMSHYGRDRFVLRSTLNLFSDARAITRETGRLSDEFLAHARRHRIADIIQGAYTLADIPSARGIASPASTSWGVPWIPDGASPLEAIEALSRHFSIEDSPKPVLDSDALPHWDRLPLPVQRLIARMLIADAVARPWVLASIDPALIRNAAIEQLRLAGIRGTSISANTYGFEQSLAGAQELWRENPGSLVYDPRPAPASRALLEQFDQAMMAYASVVYFRHADAAIDEYRAWQAQSGWQPDTNRPLRGFRFETPLGPVRVLSSGDDRLAVGIEIPFEEIANTGTLTEPNGVALVVDLGGNDTYLGRIATPNLAGVMSGNSDTLLRPIAAVIDLGGNDTYDAQGLDGAIACGLFGIGAIFDLAGDDRYIGAGSSIARAIYGTGVLIDFDGNDQYISSGFFSQSAAHVGVSLLLDRSGNDRYTVDALGQALGSTRGVGLLIDLEGNDQYRARDNGWLSPLYRNQSVSMAQGVGYGRRADFGDGYSLAGGWGMLIDGEGDDEYHASVWSQGAGYWWGVGVLEDRGGNDRHRGSWYSLGAAAHFGIGHAVNLAGDDSYNIENARAVGQYLGSARDGSIAIFIDGDGNDRYLLRNRCGGSADLGSVGIFWDRSGDDRYLVSLDTTINEDPALGVVIGSPMFRSFRDDLISLGLFLDTQGDDEYRTDDLQIANNADWDRSIRVIERALGLDIEFYSPARIPR